MNQPIPLNPQGYQDPQLPERRDAAENRARILRAAEDLFAEHGVSAVNMAEIAQAAGVGKGTLYRNFSNKGDLCLTLLDTQLRDFQEQRLLAMREQAQSGLPCLRQLARFLDALVIFSDRHMPLLCEVQQHSDVLDGRETRRPHFWQYMTVRGLLRSAVQAAELPHNFDTEFAAEALLAPLAPHTFRFQRQVLGFDLSRMSRGVRTILDGLESLTRQSHG